MGGGRTLAEPASRHGSQEFRIIHGKAGSVSDHGINCAMWTARGGTLVVRPLLDLGRDESAATIEATAEFAPRQLLLVVAAMAMRLVQHFRGPEWACGGIDEHAPKGASTYPLGQLHMVKLAQRPQSQQRVESRPRPYSR